MALVDMIPPPGTDDFLKSCGWPCAKVVPLAGDASFRRYFRIIDGHRVAVLMDAPPPHEDPRPFVRMAEYLRAIGLRAPAIIAQDYERGQLLIEDFGDCQMRAHVDNFPDEEISIYEGVVDLLISLHQHPPHPDLQRHGLDNWLDEVEMFITWYGAAVDLKLDPTSFRSAWRDVLAPVEQDGIGWVTELRDYHAENIMLIDGAKGPERFGLLDFQDAMVGHPAYDLVSMLEDARRDVPPAIEAAMLDHYIRRTGMPAAFQEAYWALGAQRNTRILGVFCRLWKRDGKAHYTRFQPRMWGLLDRDLAHPSLAPVKSWFDAHVPAEKRAPIWQHIAT